jgi:hypothetical protein
MPGSIIPTIGDIMPVHRHPGTCLATAVIGAALLTLAACGGGGSSSSAAAAAAPVVAASAATITQSTITLPMSVQVVSAK